MEEFNETIRNGAHDPREHRQGPGEDRRVCGAASDSPLDASRIIKEYEPEPEEVLLAAPPAHKKQVIERDTDLLTPEELRKHADEVKAAMLSELKQWGDRVEKQSGR